MDSQRRPLPNILITGTPGTGKSTICMELCERTDFEHIDIGDVAKEFQLYEEYDEEFECHILDEDKVVTELEDKILGGGKVVDYHGCDFFPEKWFDVVFVLTTDNTVLYDRLARRGCNGKKLENNMECEIFQVLLDEARDAYDPKIVIRLCSNTPDDMEANLEQICDWIEVYKSKNVDG